MNSDAFSHGKVHSKIWLCAELKNLYMLNMLVVDIDPNTKVITDQITEA
jgi:hypothetical protein